MKCRFKLGIGLFERTLLTLYYCLTHCCSRWCITQPPKRGCKTFPVGSPSSLSSHKGARRSAKGRDRGGCWGERGLGNSDSERASQSEIAERADRQTETVLRVKESYRQADPESRPSPSLFHCLFSLSRPRPRQPRLRLRSNAFSSTLPPLSALAGARASHARLLHARWGRFVWGRGAGHPVLPLWHAGRRLSRRS